MDIIKIPIKELVFYEKNAKKHPKSQIDKIMKSIKAFGFRNPILIDEKKTIIAGHGRVMAAKRLKHKDVLCIYVDDLTPEQVKAYRLADNRTAESDWDMETLKYELEELNTVDFDITLTGFDDKELNEIMDYVPEERETDTKDVDKLGSLVVTCPKCGEKFKRKDSK